MVIGELVESGARFVAVCEDTDVMAYMEANDMLGASVTVSTNSRGRGEFALASQQPKL
jgi:hypothetical protein